MFDFFDYIRRWISTKALNLAQNTAMTAGIMFITCLAVKKDVFSTFGATKACLFSVLMCCIWSGLFNSIALFYSEREYLPDDLSKFLHVHTYVAANFTIQFFLCVVEAMVSAVVFSLFFHFDSECIVLGNRSIDFFLTFFLITMSADMLGLLVGMLISNINSIMTIVPVILIAQLLLSGCLFDLEGIMEKAANFTPARWGFYALGSTADLNSMLPDGAKLDIFRFEARYVLYCWSLLLLLTVICTFLSGILLYFKVNHKES